MLPVLARIRHLCLALCYVAPVQAFLWPSAVVRYLGHSARPGSPSGAVGSKDRGPWQSLPCSLRRRVPARRPRARALLLASTEPAPAPPDDGEYDMYQYQPEYDMQDETMFDGDSELLEKWRLERLLSNDLWQFDMYQSQHAGQWLGLWQSYQCETLAGEGEVTEAGAGPLVVSRGGAAFAASTSVCVDGATDETVSGMPADQRQSQAAPQKKSVGHQQMRMEAANGALPPVVRNQLYPDDFRAEKGSQVVGNCYTHGAVHDGDGAWFEIGLRDKDVRVRCLFNYRAADGGNSGGGTSSQQQHDADMPRMNVESVYLVREGLSRLPAPDASSDRNLYGAAGRGLYDPPRETRNARYYTIYAEGGLTVRFPLWMEAAAGEAGKDDGGALHCISVDWAGGAMRFQADRKMKRMDGSCEGLDLTEIQTEDSERYLPMN